MTNLLYMILKQKFNEPETQVSNNKRLCYGRGTARRACQ